MTNRKINALEEKPFKSRWPLWVKGVSIFVIGSFLFTEVASAADPSGFQLKREREKESKFLPRYLLEQQQKHEDFIQQKEDQSNLAKSLEDEFTQRMRKKKPFLEDDRRRGGTGENNNLQYTLGDPDENGDPTTLSVYEYAGGKLVKITEYDVSGVDISQYVSGAQETKGKEWEKFKGG